ncbi:MAG: 3-hydroxyacyl-CoA dehydrogenase family protein [Thermaerobacter sp.]|nr:3-hydroxyacyl-CoA dehydrogenase family protein [Thermaerobacter sp.]
MNEAEEHDLIDRFALATFLEGARLWEEGIASIEAIDLAMRAGAGLPMGPFMWADTIGLDAVLGKLETLSARYGQRFAAPVSLTERVLRGQLGKQSGRGYLTHRRSG